MMHLMLRIGFISTTPLPAMCSTVNIYLSEVSYVTFELADSIYIFASKNHSRDNSSNALP